MAAASYVSDLTDIFADGDTTGWSALGGGQAGLNQETDYYVQGTSCLSKNAFANSTRGMIFVNTARIIPTDGAVFMWVTHQTANSLDLIANGGLQVLVGNTDAAFRQYYIAGSDTIIYDDRWVCIPIDPAVATADATTGAPNATYSCFGLQAAMVGGPTKGSPLAMDAIRFGKNYTYTLGDLANGYATFDGAATFNDNINRRYGFIQLSGKTYKMQGTHNLGSAGAAVDFRDSNRSIVIADTPKTSANFNKININNASSNVEINSVQISALGTTAKGNFECVDSATVLLNSCTFTDMGTFIFNGVTNLNTITSSTFRRCDSVTTNSGTLTDCLITNSIVTGAVGAVVTDNLEDIVTCDFIRGASGHAVELTSLGGGTMAWNSIATDYAAGSAGTTTTANGNETIYVNVSTGSLTITAAEGATVPSIRTAGATITVVVAPVVIRITVTDTSGVPIENARVQISATETAGTVTTGDVLLTGLTDVNGILENIAFVYQSAWDAGGGLNIKIKCRQGSVSPFKVPSSTVGTIVAGSGYQAVVALQPDE